MNVMNGPLSKQVERQESSLQVMMERLGVDLSRLVRMGGGTTFAEARRRCLECRRTRNCAQWLADSGAAVGAEPAFCPVLPLFHDMARL